ncbi:CAP domain-containing protein [Leisingera sp. ANG-Vp]|uniref:CAP domain-containing protein n=1 Tax=Leisingera sp. ANG-Vp TaxID=1577896 RepID=UPI00057F5EB2|nr:CAP domain-containing protein [Leisingera sp. ANG-Vp]KIC21558.1 hypothetical protein RA20_04275 [Leisingera sp. ANG-Vp]
MSQASELERQMLDLINAERTSRGLNPVQLELRLNDSAEDHSEWMLQQDVFSHTGAGGSSAGDRMEDAGFVFSGSWTWAENIAWQSERGAPGLADDVIDLHNSLMNSPGHRANILNANVEVIGIGIEQGNFNGWDAVMVTQNFARTSAPLQLDSGGSSGGGSGATAGNDSLTLDSAGTLSGLEGNDTLTGSGGNDRLNGNSGKDKLTGGGGNDSLYAGTGADTLSAGSGSDQLFGGDGRDQLRGGLGSDQLQGGNHGDRLWAGRGYDTLDGGNGNDRLTGEGGGDIFVFSAGNDTVTDFQISQYGEKIDLDGAAGISSFDDLAANHAVQSGSDVVITDTNGNSLRIEDVSLASLGVNDFLF